MKYIKKITPQDFNKGLEDFYDVATKQEFWEVKGAYAFDHYLCWATLDDSCYFCYDPKTGNFIYFAIEKELSNIRALAETVYEIVCAGYPFIKITGRKGRYPRILKAFGSYSVYETDVKGFEEIVWYAGHPDNIEKIKRRFN